MQVMIENHPFPREIGVSILKSKYKECPFEALESCWDSIPELTFPRLVRDLPDPERRRIAFSYLGLDRVLQHLHPERVSTETIRKSTRWLEDDGTPGEMSYDDTYSLYRVGWRQLYGNPDIEGQAGEGHPPLEDFYFIQFHDTTTAHTVALWVDLRDVCRTNPSPHHPAPTDDTPLSDIETMVNPVMAIAWTFLTDLAPDDILAILRQGDCLLFKRRPGAVPLPAPRRLTEREYRAHMRDES